MDETRRINTDYYNKNAERWAAIKTNSFYHEEGFRKFASLLNEGNSVIDIGCAYGIHVPLFLGIGNKLKYEGFDISEKMIEMAQSRYPQIKFSVGDILDKTTLPKKKCDAFWAGAILMHIPKSQWDEMFNNIQDLINSGGTGYFTLPTDRPGEASEEDQRHFTILKEDELNDFLKNKGWKILEKGDFPSDNRSMWNWYIVKMS